MDTSRLKKLDAVINRQTQLDILNRNREATKRVLVEVILSVTGWQSLEPFAMTAIDNAIHGLPVDLVKLKADIADWRQQQSTE